MESNSISANPAATFTRQSRWILASREELNGGAIAWSEICASECIARLLLRKGFHSAEEVENFLRPRLNSLSDPFLLPQMETAVSRVLGAHDRHERNLPIERAQNARKRRFHLIPEKHTSELKAYRELVF